ncbi:AraC family transcriptional regulator [Falsiroseomonas oryzae]|uniref:AraC family transcriptional regulator n=1 Tax=Falsiroseomonas oryzae TaxID=2766473 RepID=UPI0022EB8659|nr:AraC family transcriptional regulator [Roseomonas sp. MO-31]
MPDPPIGSATFRFDDFDSFAAAISDADVVYVPVNPGSFRAELTQIQLGRVIIQLGRDSPHLSRGVAGAGRIGMLISQHGPEGTIFNGHAIGPDDLMMFRPGAPLDSTVAVDDAWAHLTFTEDDGEALTEAWGVPFGGADRYRFLRGEASSLGPLRQCFRRAAQFVVANPANVATEGFAASLTDMLAGHLGELLAGSRLWDGPTRQSRRVLSLVAQADDYLRANLARPIYTTEVCTALGASPRTLHDAFQAVHGMSLHGYLHRRRMALVRDALKRASGSTALVKTIALTYGFWSLGRFSVTYRHMFGESPSATLGQQPRGPRRTRPG